MNARIRNGPLKALIAWRSEREYCYSMGLALGITTYTLGITRETYQSDKRYYTKTIPTQIFNHGTMCVTGFPCSSVGKESACNTGDPASIPGLGRSPGEGNGYPLQYSCLENAMDRGAWQATVHGVAMCITNVLISPLLFISNCEEGILVY